MIDFRAAIAGILCGIAIVAVIISFITPRIITIHEARLNAIEEKIKNLPK